MALETPTYISDLVVANPTATDNVSEGDDHIRNLKVAIKASFPGVSGAVTATHTELNVLDGVTASTAELNVLDGISGVTVTQLNYLSGLTSNAQAQLATKLPGAPTVSVKTDNFDAATGFHYILRTASSKTATMPASPVAGDYIWFTNHSGGNWTVGRNGKPIMGAASDDTMATGTHYEYLYIDATTGWARLGG